MKATPSGMFSFEQRHQERLKIEVRKPATLKIDSYLEQYKELRYLYDFGDGWEFTVTLEQIVNDYYFGYPTLLEGAETAPSEDVVVSTVSMNSWRFTVTKRILNTRR